MCMNMLYEGMRIFTTEKRSREPTNETASSSRLSHSRRLHKMASEATRLHPTALSLRDGEMSTAGKNEDDGDRAIEWMVGTAVILVLASTVLTPVFIGISGTDRGTFGDQFGVTNALFSGLAAVFTVATLQLQRQAMVAQREDVASTVATSKPALSTRTRTAKETRKDNSIARACRGMEYDFVGSSHSSTAITRQDKRGYYRFRLVGKHHRATYDTVL